MKKPSLRGIPRHWRGMTKQSPSCELRDCFGRSYESYDLRLPRNDVGEIEAGRVSIRQSAKETRLKKGTHCLRVMVYHDRN